MNGTGIVFVGGGKGGVGKSATSHLACLGAILCNQPAAYVLTDPSRKMRGEGRPYGVLDGRMRVGCRNPVPPPMRWRPFPVCSVFSKSCLLGFLQVLPTPAHTVDGWLDLLRRRPVTGGGCF